MCSISRMTIIVIISSTCLWSDLHFYGFCGLVYLLKRQHGLQKARGTEIEQPFIHSFPCGPFSSVSWSHQQEAGSENKESKLKPSHLELKGQEAMWPAVPQCWLLLGTTLNGLDSLLIPLNLSNLKLILKNGQLSQHSSSNPSNVMKSLKLKISLSIKTTENI